MDPYPLAAGLILFGLSVFLNFLFVMGLLLAAEKEKRQKAKVAELERYADLRADRLRVAEETRDNARARVARLEAALTSIQNQAWEARRVQG